MCETSFEPAAEVVQPGLAVGRADDPVLGALTFGYKSTINDSDPGDLSMDAFMITLVSGWHPLIEGARRAMAGTGRRPYEVPRPLIPPVSFLGPSGFRVGTP